MINAVYRDKPVIFMKTVSDTEFDMMNAVYRDKPLIFIGATFKEKLFSHHRAVNEADSCLRMRCAGSKAVAQTKAFIVSIHVYHVEYISYLLIPFDKCI